MPSSGGAFRLAGWLGRTAMLSAIVLLVAYGRLVGGGASVDRATLTAVVYLGSRVFDHRTPPLNTIAFAAGRYLQDVRPSGAPVQGRGESAAVAPPIVAAHPSPRSDPRSSPVGVRLNRYRSRSTP